MVQHSHSTAANLGQYRSNHFLATPPLCKLFTTVNDLWPNGGRWLCLTAYLDKRGPPER